MSSEDAKSQDSQFDFDLTLKDSSSLVLYVRDKKNLRKFTASYNATTLAAKGLTQTVEKLIKILKTASKNRNENWSMKYGYFTKPNRNGKDKEQIDLLPTYLSRSEISALRKKPKHDDTLFIILQINEDFFTIDTQFKLYEIDTPTKTKSTKSRRTLSGVKSFGKAEHQSQKLLDMEAKIKSLTRDNQVLKRKILTLESVSGKKQKKMDSEREMRLKANKERFWLKQKLDRLQKAIAARLKILGVDFSQVDDITSALDMAFNVIQKLAKELQKKEEDFEGVTLKMNKAVREAADFRKNKDKLDATIEKQRGVMGDLRKQIADRDRRLSIVAHEKNDNESMLTKQLEDVENQNKELRAEKENMYNQMVDMKSKLKRDLKEALSDLQDVKDELNKSTRDNEDLLGENEENKQEMNKLLNNNNELNAKLHDALNQIEELKNELDDEKNKNDLLLSKNKKLMQQINKLLDDLAKLKELLRKALNIELKLKGVLDDTNDFVSNMKANNEHQDVDEDY